MSLRHARAFVKKLHTDAHLRNSVHLDRDHIVKAARREGYTVTTGEIRTAINEHWKTHSPAGRTGAVLSEAPGF